MSYSRKMVIKHHRPLHFFVVVALSCFMISITIWIFLDESQWSYIKESLSETRKSGELWQENIAMKSQIVEFEEQILMLERTAQVEKQTISNLQKDMIEQQDEIYHLKKELEFYQGIMTSTGESTGLKIQDLRIEETFQSRGYYFKLILTRISKSDKVIMGRLSMQFEGLQGGEPKTIDIRELILSDSPLLNFKFKNFKRLGGSFMLPEGFIAHRVLVQAYPDRKKKISAIERVFDWSEAVSH